MHQRRVPGTRCGPRTVIGVSQSEDRTIVRRSAPEGESARPGFERRLRSPVILLAAASVGLLGVLALLYLSTWHTVWVEINGRSLAHRTRESTARGVLNELRLDLAPEDFCETPDSDALLEGESIRISVARTVALVHDGSVSQTRTQAQRVVEALADLGVVALPEDRYYLMEQPYELYGDLPEVRPTGRLTPHRLIAELRKPIVLRVERAVPVTVDDGSVTFSFNTAARTVGAALFEQGLTVYEGDRVSPGLDAAITPGLRVRLDRALPVYLDDGGEARQLRTHSTTVEDLLAEEQVALDEDDYVRPEVVSRLHKGMTVSVVRVSDEYFIEEVPVPFQTVQVADPNMEIDRREIMHWGREGASRTKYRVHYENGVEMSRSVEEQWLHRDPIHRATHYGTGLVYRDLPTPYGTYSYWRVLRMLATSYNAPTAGTPFDAPNYGITRIGWKARKGLVAVDPRVIPLRQEVYVPGYGPGTAADTGSAIQWRRIDLCYDLDNLVLWYKWVDVYLLAPPPSRDQILWQVPNTPVEKE